MKKYRLGDLIQQRREKNKNYDVPVRGVTRTGFIEPKQERVDVNAYNVFYLNDFVFNSARMEINSIVFNDIYEKGICSPIYDIFYITRTDILLSGYLNLFVKRDEFARRCQFLSFGSAHNSCHVEDISEIELYLPSIIIQEKVITIYNAMKANQKIFEHGLDDLKLTCDAYIENLRQDVTPVAIGDYIKESDERNTALKYDVNAVKGITTEKQFIETKANMEDVKLNSYKIVNPKQFAYVADTSRRGDKMSMAFNDSENTYLVSSISTVFYTNGLLPEYLFLFFRRDEFNRYTRFHSWGSAREVFSFEDMKEVKIPIPDIMIQKAIVDIFNVYNERKAIVKKLKRQIKDICPILVRGALNN